MPTTKNKKFPFKIGADPEFNMLIDDRHFCAVNLLENMFTNELTRKSMGFEIEGVGEIGWDGNDDIGELRPNPANTPEEITENLKKLITKIVTTNPLLELSTLCDTGTVGGHVHFELGDNSIPTSTLETLSRRLASFYLPLIMSEDKLNLKTRGRSYGKLTDHRADRHGNKYTFEFRAPSAEWMTTEKIAFSTLAYLATVYNEITHHHTNFLKSNAILLKNQNQAAALKDLAVSDFHIIMKALINKVKKYVKTFEFYPQYKEEIDFILSAEKVNKEKAKVNYNISEGWGIIKYKTPTKRQVFSRLTTNKKDTKNIDEITQTIPLYHNPDTNVIEFANHLKMKIAQLNWKMNNHYFLFGLRKGIEDFIITDKNFDFLHGQNQIETMDDKYCIDETLNRINQKFPMTKRRLQKKIDEASKKYILIGIPYELRLNLKYRPLMEHIFEIEKGRTKIKALKKNLPEYIDQPGEEASRGKIYNIYNKRNNENLQSEQNRITVADRDLTEATREIELENAANKLNKNICVE